MFIYHCRNCKTNFEFPMELSDGYKKKLLVCPRCKSNDWGNIAE